MQTKGATIKAIDKDALLEASNAHSRLEKRSEKSVDFICESLDIPRASFIELSTVSSKKIYSECEFIARDFNKESEPFPYGPSLISAVLVIAGWVVVNKAQSNRERRKQIREFVSNLMKELAELEKAVLEYHTNQRDESLEQSILVKLTRFEKACELLPKFVSGQRYLKATPPTKLVINPPVIQQMRKAMTLHHFMDEHLSSMKNSDLLIQEIVITTYAVLDTLERVRLASLD